MCCERYFALEKADLQGFDVIIDAFGEWQDLSLHKKHIEFLDKILQGNSAKLVVVGGAGSLYMDKSHTTRLMDTPDFPKEYMGVAEATAEVLKQRNIEKIILLGTKYTMTGDFYKDKLIDSDISVVVPDDSSIEVLNNIIYQELCLGIISQE